jgi:hypothetical protein
MNINWEMIDGEVEKAMQLRVPFTNEVRQYLAISNELWRTAEKAYAEQLKAQASGLLTHYERMRIEARFGKAFFDLVDCRLDLTSRDYFNDEWGCCRLSMREIDEEYVCNCDESEGTNSAIIALFEKTRLLNKRLDEFVQACTDVIASVDVEYAFILKKKMSGEYDEEQWTRQMFIFTTQLQSLRRKRMDFWEEEDFEGVPELIRVKVYRS